MKAAQHPENPLRVRICSTLPSSTDDLLAANSGRNLAADGSAHFSRPAPRIVDSLGILAHIVHPQLFAPPALTPAFSRVNLTRATAQ